MKTGWMTLGMLAAAAAILFAFPSLRDAAVVFHWDDALGIPTNRERVEVTAKRLALANPNDPKLWFAYAVEASSPFSTLHADRTALEKVRARAMQLSPRSPAVPFVCASQELLGPELLRYPPKGPIVLAHPKPDAIERADIDLARELLLRARKLAPDNAACDYLLALEDFREDRTGDGNAYLTSAMGKQGFDRYYREWCEAAEPVYAQGPKGRELKWVDASGGDKLFEVSARLRDLARYLAFVGDGARARGDDKQAMFCCEASLHLMHLLRLHAYSGIDTLLGAAIGDIATYGFLSKAQLAQVHAARAVHERRRLEVEMEPKAFAKWADAHGRPDLAAQFAEDRQADHAARQRFAEIVGPEISGPLRAAYNGLALAPPSALSVLLLFASVLLALVTTVALRRKPPTGIGYRTWAVLLALLLVPGQLCALGYLIFARDEIMWDFAWEPGLNGLWIAQAVGVALWIVGVIVISRRRKARWLLVVRDTIWPTLAAVVLVGVLGLVPVQSGLSHLDHEYKQIAAVGEVRYWGLDTPSTPGVTQR